MANDSALIQKVRKDKISGEGTKKVVYPKTIDKAVAVKKIKEEGYETLDVALPRKWEKAWAITTKIEDTNESAYYLFYFNNNIDVIPLKKYLSCSNEEFIAMIMESGSANDKSRLEEYDYNYIGVDPYYTENNMLERISFDVMKEKFLSYIKLHDTIAPKIVVEDGDGNEYTDGSTVVVDSYPAKFRVKYSIIPEGFGEYFASYIQNATSDVLTNSHYSIRFESSIKEAEDVKMATKVANASTLISNRPMNGNQNVYANPLNFTYDYEAEPDFILSRLNEFISYGRGNNYMEFWVLPEDYPTDSSQQTAYEQEKTRQGTFSIRNYFVYGGQETDAPLYIQPFSLKLIFNVTQVFSFLSPYTGNPYKLNKTNSYVQDITFQGINADENAQITISFPDNVVDYVFYTPDDLSTPKTSATITPAQLEEGYTVVVKPSNWSSSSNYVPFPTPRTEEVNINCRYVVDQDEKTLTAVIRCEEKQSDLPTDSSVECITRVYDDTTRAGYLDFYLNSGVNHPLSTVKIKNINSIYYALNSTGWSTSPLTLTNVKVYKNTTPVSGVFREEDYVLHDGSDITCDVANVSAISLKFLIPTEDQNGNIISGKGLCETFIDAKTTTNRAINGTCSLEFTSVVSGIPSTVVSAFRAWCTENNITALSTSVDSVSSELINSLVNNNVNGRIVAHQSLVGNRLVQTFVANTTVLDAYVFESIPVTDTSILEVLTQLDEIPDGAFANNQYLTSVVIPSNITKIGRYAFYNCTNLRELVIPDSVTNLNESFAEGCTNLETIDLGQNVRRLRQYSLYGCPNLKTIISRRDDANDIIGREDIMGQITHPIFDPALDGADDVTFYFATDTIRDIVRTSFANDGHGGFVGNDFSNATVLTIGEDE